MAQQLRRLEADIIPMGPGLFDTEEKKWVWASPLGAPVNLKVSIRDTTSGTEEFYDRLSVAAHAIINIANMERPGDADAYVDGKERPSYVESHVLVPVQFYKLGRK